MSLLMALGKGKPGSKGQICISTQLGVQYWGRSVHNTRFVGHEKPGCGMREEHITLPAENLRHPGVNRSIRTPVIQNKQLLFFIEAHRAALARGCLDVTATSPLGGGAREERTVDFMSQTVSSHLGGPESAPNASVFIATG